MPPIFKIEGKRQKIGINERTIEWVGALKISSWSLKILVWWTIELTPSVIAPDFHCGHFPNSFGFFGLSIREHEKTGEGAEWRRSQEARGQLQKDLVQKLE